MGGPDFVLWRLCRPRAGPEAGLRRSVDTEGVERLMICCRAYTHAASRGGDRASALSGMRRIRPPHRGQRGTSSGWAGSLGAGAVGSNASRSGRVDMLTYDYDTRPVA